MVEFGVFAEQLRDLFGDVDARDGAVELALFPNPGDHRDLLALQPFRDGRSVFVQRFLLARFAHGAGPRSLQMWLLGRSG